MTKSLFSAYPSEPPDIGQTIEAAEKLPASGLKLKTWRTAFGPGNFIDRNILPEIKRADGLIFDLSITNNNVFFEAGYAIGLQKPIIPICNASILNAGKYLKEIGIFDNIGFYNYENGRELRDALNRLPFPEPLFRDHRPVNRRQPIYVLDALRRSEFAAKVISSVKESIKFYRSFDPQEEYRLSVRSAWEDVSQSTGVLVTLLSDKKDDYLFHNLRASFLAGLAVGMGRECLVLADHVAEPPLDFRDQCKVVKHPDDIAHHVNEFGVRALRALQETGPSTVRRAQQVISRVSVGSAAAENEFRDLADYYVDTGEYRAALEGRGRLVIGRKGSGKTAIFWRVRDTIRTKDRRNLVVDLKPDGYQLRKFKEQLVKLLSAGTKEHTLTAFWEYLIYGELICKIFEDDYQRFYGRDGEVTERLDKLNTHYSAIIEGREGDFSERMMGLLNQVSSRFKEKYGNSENDRYLSSDEVTDLIYKTDVRGLQNETLDYLSHKDRTVILVDNIDKGWGAHGVDSDDVIIIRTLMEALRKIERQASRREIWFNWLLLLRNDVFELLVDEQSDRGKEDKIVVDWDSKEALREVIARRIEASTQDGGKAKGATWHDIAEPIIDGMDSLDWLIARSLMRPRYLIEAVHQCLGHASTSRHGRIEEADFREGYRMYSLDIIGNTNFEMRDVFPAAYDSIYSLIDIHRLTKISDIKEALRKNKYPEEHIDKIIDTLFWFGILGAKSTQGEEKYIYDYRYDEKIFSRVRQTDQGEQEPVFINLAFSKGLDCRDLI